MLTNPDAKTPTLRLVTVVIGILVVIAALGIYAVYRPRAPKIGTATTTAATAHLDEGVAPDKYGRLNADAQVSLSRALCDHDERCQKIGQGNQYDDRQRCESDRRDQVSKQYPGNVCSRGMAPDKVEACAKAIHASDCKTSLNSLQEYPPCTADVLCH